ncbi:hypothetical protein EVAR_25215_1 [Eumeta japonica]|uniref:Uncharacterized protein n=1 Tax=Eumeta variegata TaxID=151549 RepID=A0A4C1WGK2_EUMVA|nr:hypothetical protein EVAR_25215_1 [Eumeta japonica]
MLPTQSPPDLGDAELYKNFSKSASTRARASQKYRSRISLPIGGFGPRIGTPISYIERIGRFQECPKVVMERSVDDADSVSDCRCCPLMIAIGIVTSRYTYVEQQRSLFQNCNRACSDYSRRCEDSGQGGLFSHYCYCQCFEKDE